MEATISTEKSNARVLARVYAYVALGLLLTAVVALAVGGIISSALLGPNGESTAEFYLYLIIGSAIALLVDAIVMRVIMIRNNHSGWIPYVIYCTLFGIFLSTFVVIGVPFYLMGEAFAISAVVFLILFLLGYFSPFNLNVVATIGLGLVFGLLLIGLISLLMIAVIPEFAFGIFALSSGIILVVMLICIAADSYNIKRIISSGVVSDNTVLLCASTLYNDFIYIFVRVLLLLIRLKGRNK